MTDQIESMALSAIADEQINAARSASSGRSARTVHGGHDVVLRQTVIALAAGRGLAEHDSPGEATLQVLAGRVRLTAGGLDCEGAAGDYVVVPAMRHSVEAVEDAVILLTVVASTAAR